MGAGTQLHKSATSCGRDNRIEITRLLLDLIGELSAELAPDPPCKATLAGAAFRQYDGELRGNVDIFGDYLYAAVRHVRYRAVAGQRAGPELDPREPSAETTFAAASIC